MHLKRQHYIIGFTLIFVLALLVGLKLNKKCDKSDYARCKLLFGDISLDVTIAYSKESQAKGLMGVKNLKDNEGMIFVYDEPSYLSFWMKNTLIPLSIAFVEADGRIAEIYNMKVEGEKKDYEFPVYQSPTMVRYAVEAPSGWFTLNGIQKNDRMTIPESLK
jgi:hypothetical protein